MALTVQNITRIFSFTKNSKTISLADPNPSLSPEEVMNFYASTYPELTTSTVHGPEINNDRAEYTFKTTIGTKG